MLTVLKSWHDMSPKLVSDVRALLQELVGIRSEVNPKNIQLKDQVELGQLLWDLAQESNRLLTPLKDALRQEALARSAGKPGRQLLHGRSSTALCTVVVQAPVFRLKEGVSEPELQRLFGADTPLYFGLNPLQVKPDIQQIVDKASPETLGKLAQVLDYITPPPRVSFKDPA